MAIIQIGITTGVNKKEFVGLSTDTKPTTDIGAGSKFYEKDTRNTYIFDGISWQELDIKYKDLGLVIDTINMAAGSTVYSNWYDNVQWVRNIITHVSTDQNWQVRTKLRETTLQGGMVETSIATGNSLPGNFSSNVITGSNAIVGYSVKFGLQNTAASGNTFAKLRVQFLGQ